MGVLWPGLLQEKCDHASLSLPLEIEYTDIANM